MRFSWGFALGAIALGAQANRLAVRQDVGTTSPAPLTTSTSNGGNGGQSSTTDTTSAPEGGGDTTVQVTRTVTQGGGGSTVSSTTTVSVSTVVTVSVTTTDIATTTVTSRDKDTATKTVYVTSTQIVNAKRAVEDDIFVGDGPALVEAQATPAPVVLAPQAGNAWFQHVKNNQRRAVVTNFVTVTVGSGGGDSTIVVTATRAIRSTTTTLIHTTSFVTETEQANAKTTITTTSTIVLKLTQVSTGVIETSTSSPTAGAGNGNNNNDDGGLSTGAKAGIGAGVGVAALLAIGAILFCCMKRRRSPKPDPDDLLGPSSEVPVGAAAGGSRSSRPMSEGLSSSAPGAVPRRSPVLPNVQPEGYRGTAMGDGRAGYAKPETYGAAYVPTRSTTTNTRSSTLSPGDQLPRHPTPETITASVSPMSPGGNTAELGNDGAGAKWHQSEAAEMATDNPAAAKWHSDNAHEIDSQPVMTHQSGPVYEMPTEPYR